MPLAPSLDRDVARLVARSGELGIALAPAEEGAPLDPYRGLLESLLVSPLSGVKVTSRVGACLLLDLRCCPPVVPVGAVVPFGVVVLVPLG